MEPSEIPIVSEGLFSLCDDFGEEAEEAKIKTSDQASEDQYLNYRDCIIDKGADLGGKGKKRKYSSDLKLNEELADYKPNILNIRSKLKAEKVKGEESKKFSCTTNIFQIPSTFYSTVVKSIYFKDTDKSIDLEEIASNRNDYDYMKEIKSKVGQGKFIHFKTFNGDIFTIHKNLVNVFKHEFDEEEETEDNKFAFLSEKTDDNTTNIDFSDKGALLKRQRKILAEIEEHKKSKEAEFQPMGTLSTGLKKWFIILCQGGKFCIAKIHGDKIIEHKSDSKYVQRKKAGKRQINFDKKSSCMTSVGSQMRRNNERLHQEHIEETLKFYKEDLDSSDLILLHAPGVNKLFFVGPEKPLRDLRGKVKTLNLQITTANYTELQKAFEKVIEMKVTFNS